MSASSLATTLETRLHSSSGSVFQRWMPEVIADKAAAQQVLEVARARADGREVVVVLGQETLLWADKQGQSDSIQLDEVESSEGSQGLMAGRMEIRAAGRWLELKWVEPEGRAKELARLVSDPSARRPRSPSERRRILQAALMEQTQAGFQVVYEGDFEAVVARNGWRAHHGAHAVGTVLTLGGWAAVWGTQALRSTISRQGRVVTVDPLGRATTSTRVEATMKRLTEQSLTAPDPSTPAPVAEGHKRCPDCAEEVLAAARICRYCRHKFAAQA